MPPRPRCPHCAATGGQGAGRAPTLSMSAGVYSPVFVKTAICPLCSGLRAVDPGGTPVFRPQGSGSRGRQRRSNFLLHQWSLYSVFRSHSSRRVDCSPVFSCPSFVHRVLLSLGHFISSHSASGLPKVPPSIEGAGPLVRGPGRLPAALGQPRGRSWESIAFRRVPCYLFCTCTRTHVRMCFVRTVFRPQGSGSGH